MYRKLMILAAAGMTSILGLVSAQAPAPAPAPAKQMMKGKGMMKGAGASGANAGRQSMMAKHQEMAKMVDQVALDLAALQKENDIAAIRTKLAADQALLDQVRNQMKAEHSKMATMMESMGGSNSPTEAAPGPTDHSEHKH